jgi:autotransporter-associated beta strand protein
LGATVITNTGTLAFNRSDTANILDTTVSGAGRVNFVSGTWTLGTGGNKLPDSGVVNIASGATLALPAVADIIGGLTGTGTLSIGASQVVTLANATGTRHIFSGLVTGAGGLSMNGLGTQVLDTANNYSGNTSVSRGTLEVGHSGALGSGALSISPNASNSATLALNGITLTKNITASASGTGATVGVATITSLSGVSTLAGTVSANNESTSVHPVAMPSRYPARATGSRSRPLLRVKFGSTVPFQPAAPTVSNKEVLAH